MHEVGLVDGIVDAVLARAGDRPVATVRVRIGTMHRASQGPMEQAFELVTAGTSLEDARLELVQVPVTSTCRTCAHVETAPEPLAACPACGGIEIDRAHGDELVLESIEYRAAPGVSPDGVPAGVTPGPRG